MASRNNIIQALEAVKGAVAQKNFVPILTHVLVTDDVVLGYDSEIGVRVKMESGVGCEFNVKFDTFLDLMKHLDEDDITFVSEGKKLSISCGKHKSTMSQIVEEKFPKPDIRPKPEAWQTVPAGFKEALERCLVSASKNEQDKELSAVLVTGKYVQSCDRISIVRCTLDGMDIAPTLLGRRAVGEIVRLGNPTRMAHSDPWVVMDYLNLMFVARLREGAANFPPVQNILNGREVSGPIPEGLVSALTRLQIFVAGMENPGVTASFTELGTELVGKNVTQEIHEYLDVVPVTRCTKGFSAERLLEALMYADGIDFGDTPTKPLYLKGEVSGYEYILSPQAVM